MTRTAGAPIGCQRLSRFWGLGCPKTYHEVEDTLGFFDTSGRCVDFKFRNIQLTGDEFLASFIFLAPQQNLWVAEVGLRQMIRSVLSG
ncbi:hypothetical protein [Thiolapillus sp.]|uniref:hypothetical protein n=1 Tax=Thiolapillus sp. TaxID=2017437 RepID=UPI00263A6C45|nr:hypothetical protein [Thiolapillus sp.]